MSIPEVRVLQKLLVPDPRPMPLVAVPEGLDRPSVPEDVEGVDGRVVIAQGSPAHRQGVDHGPRIAY